MILKNTALWTLSFGHLSVDLYSNLLPVAYPLLMASLDLSYAQVGLLATFYMLGSSLSQPLFGYLADRFGSRVLASAGVAWIAVFMGLVGFAWSYHSLLAIVALAALGSGAYHPQGAANASRVSGAHQGSGVSIFSIGGSLGYAISPLLAATVFSLAGLRGSILLVPFGLLAAPLLYKSMVTVEQAAPSSSSNLERGERSTAPRMNLRFLAGLIVLMGLIILRAWAAQSLANYIHSLYKERGAALATGGQMLSIVLFAGAMGTLVGGFLSDRVGRRRVIALTLAATTPLVLAFLYGPWPVPLLAAPLMGLLMGSSQVPVILITQAQLPHNLGLASGLGMGFTFAMGGFGVYITGVLADRYGLSFSLGISAFLPLVAALFSFALPAAQRQPAWESNPQAKS
jgi:FSR family fosmidomycin resistance protein-like MFS transporter